MYSARSGSNSSKRSREPLDRRVDNWIDTGLQLVDGFSGNRPGMRRNNVDRLSGSRLKNVGRWVNEKLDWLMEDEDDWQEPWEVETLEPYASRKRPLDAVSRRVSNIISSSSRDLQNDFQDEWPDENSFRVAKWQRNEEDERFSSEPSNRVGRSSTRSNVRQLPRSNRKRT